MFDPESKQVRWGVFTREDMAHISYLATDDIAQKLSISKEQATEIKAWGTVFSQWNGEEDEVPSWACFESVEED